MFRIAFLLGLLPLAPVFAQELPRETTPKEPTPVVGAEWLYDEITLWNGGKFRGLILEESNEETKFLLIRRLPGRPTFTIVWRIPKRDVLGLVRLSESDRTAMLKIIDDLDSSAIGELKRMNSLDLAPTKWLGRANGAKRYVSEHFTLDSGAPDEVTRRAAVRLEELYAAFTRVLPARHQATPTTILLAGRIEDYRKLIGPSAGPILNPAIFDPLANRIVCGTDLVRLGDELAATHEKHQQERAKLKVYEAEIKKLYKNSGELERHLESVKNQRAKIHETELANEGKFDRATSRLFALLFHEAFHSYVAEAVYRPLSKQDVRAGKGTGELPRWLNEGLAQMFETALIEGGQTRADFPDPDRLEKVKAALDRSKPKPEIELMPISELVRSEKEVFLAAHAAQQTRARSAYLTAWAAAYFLTFERRKIGDKNFDKYLVALNSGEDAVDAFRAWSGQTPAEFEKDLRAYLVRLRKDGTTEAEKK